MNAIAILLAVASIGSFARADGGLYLVPAGESGASSIEGGELVWRFPVERALVTLAVLRHDTDDPAILWLELHLAEHRDPGDHIIHFEPSSKAHGQFYLRGSGANAAGSKWAMRFADAGLGKKALRAVAKSYRLEPANALDKTKG